MKLSLEVMTEGKQKGKLLPITLPQFLIGRDPQCQLRPASPSISKRHCAVLQRDGKVFLRDFDSTNGTFVNDRQVKGEVELHDKDVLKIGPIMFTVRLEAAAPVNRPTPPPPTKSARPTETQPAKPTPAPQKPAKETPKPAPAAAGSGSNDDDIAAMLLSIDGGEGESSVSSEDIPEGTTVMDLKVPQPGAGKDQAKPGETKKPTPSGNTSSAAKEILEKYMRRPR